MPLFAIYELLSPFGAQQTYSGKILITSALALAPLRIIVCQPNCLVAAAVNQPSLFVCVL